MSEEEAEEVEVRIVYGVNPTTGWGLLATIGNDGKIVHQLMMVCPGFASDHEFVKAVQEILFRKMECDGLVFKQTSGEEKVDENN